MMKSNFPASKIILLDNIRSSHNVGSIFRVADTVGIEEVVLAGVTPLPIDRFGRPNAEISKTALGAEKTLQWRYVENSLDYILEKQKEGFDVVVLEQDQKSVDYKTINLKPPFVFIVGNEVDGVRREILDSADLLIEIPMQGQKESLNVSVASAVALFRILNI